MPAITPIAFAQAIVRALRRGGVDPAPILKQAQIAPGKLAQASARINAAQMETLSALAMERLDDEALGWFSRRLPWGSYGMLIRASLTAPQLGLAMRRWCRHHGLLTDDLGLEIEVDRNVATLAVHERVDLGVQREFCLVTLLRNAHGVACWLVDSRIPLLAVDLPFAAPAHAELYRHMFPGPARFGAARAALTFDARYLALPLRRDEAALQQLLKRALPLVVLPYRRDRLLAQRAHGLLRTQASELRDATALAAALNLSPRTLHRQLRDEGTSLQALKDEARRELAVAQLLRTGRPVKQVALAAGFTNAKSFARAFRGWTGLTPQALRRQAREP